MPIKVIVDTSGATDAELHAFNASTADAVKALSDAATRQRFGFEYRALPLPSAIAAADVYKETMATIRYYGGVRYIFIPIYLAAMAALASQYFKSDNAVPHLVLVSAGLLVSLILVVFEVSLSNNLRLLWKEIGNMIGGEKVFASGSGVDPLPHRKHTRYLWFLRGTLAVPYVVGLLFWACLALHICRCAIPG